MNDMNPLIGKDEADQIVSVAEKNPHAVALGRLGGAAGNGVISERKSASSRANMQKAAQASAAKKRAKKAAVPRALPS